MYKPLIKSIKQIILKN